MIIPDVRLNSCIRFTVTRHAQLRRKNLGIDTIKGWIRHRIGGYRIAVTDITISNLLYRCVNMKSYT